jgi:nicotinamidase-related amidase
MGAAINGPDISKSALVIVDMQNDFVHPDGYLADRAREVPDRGIDLPFLTGSIHNVKRLATAFRAAGRPVIYLAHVVKPDYSDAQFPYWHLGLPSQGNRTFITEGTWGARIADDLEPRKEEHLIVKKGVQWICKYATRPDPAHDGDDYLCDGWRHNMHLRVVNRSRRCRT